MFEKIPTVNPDYVSLLSVVLSIVFVLLNNIFLLFLILFLDYLDGVFARRLNKKDEHIDLACDRISELIIFTVYYEFLPFVVVNIWLSVLKLSKNINLPIILPLRHMLLIKMIFL